MSVSTKIRVGMLTLIAGVIAGCGEAPSGPAAIRHIAPANTGVFGKHDDLDEGLPEDHHPGVDKHAGVAIFIVDPAVTRDYKFGNNTVHIPAHTICDPETSGYGPGLWDEPCVSLLDHKIAVRARWQPKGGHGAVEFEPDLRFAPSSDPKKWVVLSLHDKKVISQLRQYSILWLQPWDHEWADESATDVTLKAWTSKDDNVVSRRIKHFSGYMILAGYKGSLGGDDYGY